jgi:hypothetical protein
MTEPERTTLVYAIRNHGAEAVARALGVNKSTVLHVAVGCGLPCSEAAITALIRSGKLNDRDAFKPRAEHVAPRARAVRS